MLINEYPNQYIYIYIYIYIMMMMMILGLLFTKISTPSLVREKIDNNNDIITNIRNTKIISYMI